MTDRFTSLYGNHSQAVIVEKNGKVEYFNDAAARLIPNINEAAPEDIFPAELLSYNADRFIGEAKIAGKNLVVNVTKLSDCRVFGITAPEPDDQGDWTNIFGTISYELNNSLSVLKMSSGLLLPHVENQGNSKLSRYASTIYHSYYNIQRITNNLTDFGDYTRNSMLLNRTSYDLAVSSREMIDTVRHLVSDRGVELCFKANQDSLVVYADKRRIDKLILNLLSNSLLNTPAGGTVVLSVISAGDRFILTVSDNGQGIPPDILQMAWSRYRAERFVTEQPVGVGLGLPIVHAITKQHGGSVMLESRLGIGTTVTVSIPLAKPEMPAPNDIFVDYADYDMQQLLTELSGVISSEKYSQKYMD